MNRDTFLAHLEDTTQPWDVIIIGGGATGLGAAVDAATRGYRTLLLEQHDFAKGTSSRSTKLVHGGVRYLQQGNVSLVLEALRERGLMTRNAPHLVSHLGFIVPNYTWWAAPFYGIGLKIYDMLAGRLGLGPSKHLSLEETLKRIPTLEPEGLRGGTIYYDGQFDDARLAIALAQSAADHGSTLLNYMRVVGLQKDRDLVSGVVALDEESGRQYRIGTRCVINATGVFTDNVRRLDDDQARPIVAPSQGVHIVLDRSFLPGKHAIMVPKTDDGRVLFAIPWHDRTLVGTTDTPVPQPSLEPKALPQEIEFLLTHAARYLTQDPQPADVLSVFAGLRPLVKTGESADTASVPRDHTVLTSPSGLITVTGGKWTTYRKMAQDTIDQATVVGDLPERACRTESLSLHGWQETVDLDDPWHGYGSEARALHALAETLPNNDPLHTNLPYTPAEVLWSVREEMARTVEDVLARRTRALLLDARASIEIAPRVAELIARELNRDGDWINRQIEAYQTLARDYLLTP